MRLSLYHRCAQAFFSDSLGGTCILTETYANRPMIMLGRHGKAMGLGVQTIRDLLPHLNTFAQTGKLITPVEEDYCI